MRRSRRNDDNGNPLSRRRGRSLWARLERPSLWVVFGLLGGAGAGALSLEPEALERLSLVVPGWSTHAPTGGGPGAASRILAASALSGAAPARAPAPAAPAS